MNYPRYVYVLLNTFTSKAYVGSTADVNHRIGTHLSLLRMGKHPVEDMQSDYDKYGDHFYLSVVDKISDREDRHKEYDWMRKLGSHKRETGYNYKDHSCKEIHPSSKYLFEYNGTLWTIKELSQIACVSLPVLRVRLLNLKWDVQKALETPVRKRSEA